MCKYSTTFLILLAAFSISATPLLFQSPAGPALTFDIASIKPIDRELGNYHGGSCHGIDSKYRPDVTTHAPPLGRCVFPNTTLANIIQYEFGDPDRNPLQIVGGDKWVRSD